VVSCAIGEHAATGIAAGTARRQPTDRREAGSGGLLATIAGQFRFTLEPLGVAVFRKKLSAEREDLGDVVAWRWRGYHSSSEKDFETVWRIHAEIREAYRRDPRPLLFDLDQFDYKFANRLSDVLSGCARMREIGARIALVSSDRNKKVKNAIPPTQIDRVVDIFDDEDAALAFLRSDVPTVIEGIRAGDEPEP